MFVQIFISNPPSKNYDLLSSLIGILDTFQVDNLNKSFACHIIIPFSLETLLNVH